MTGKDGKVYSLIFEITVNLRNVQCQSHHIRAASGKTFPVFPSFPARRCAHRVKGEHIRPSTIGGERNPTLLISRILPRPGSPAGRAPAWGVARDRFS